MALSCLRDPLYPFIKARDDGRFENHPRQLDTAGSNVCMVACFGGVLFKLLLRRPIALSHRRYEVAITRRGYLYGIDHAEVRSCRCDLLAATASTLNKSREAINVKGRPLYRAR